MDLLGLDRQALTAWKAFLLVESSSVFADIGRTRVRALSDQITFRVPTDTASVESMTAFANDFPGRAREFAFNRLLGHWGDSIVAGRVDAGAPLLLRATHISSVLAQRFADSSTSYAIDAIRKCRPPACQIAKLARAHSQFALAQQFASRNGYAAADRIYSDLLTHPLPTTLMGWARLGDATALIYLRPTHPFEARGVAQRTLASIDERREPLLSAHCSGSMGSSRCDLAKRIVALRRCNALARSSLELVMMNSRQGRSGSPEKHCCEMPPLRQGTPSFTVLC